MEADNKRKIQNENLDAIQENRTETVQNENELETEARMLEFLAAFTNSFGTSEKKGIRVSSLDTLKPKK